MNYVISAQGDISPLDKEHIINKMFTVCHYGKRAYFVKGDPAIDFAYEQLESWKALNHSKVELFKIEICEIDQIIIDCIMLFVSEDCDDNGEFKTAEATAAMEGIRVDKYILGTWDKNKKEGTNYA